MFSESDLFASAHRLSFGINYDRLFFIDILCLHLFKEPFRMVFICVFFYGMSYALSQYISDAMHLHMSLAALVMPLYILILQIEMIKSGYGRKIGLQPPACSRSTLFCRTMPLFILPLCSLLYTAQFACAADTLILLVCAAIAEELLFRGWFLFRLSPRPAAAVCGSSLVFALLHAANLVHHADWRFALLQILCAFFFGLSCGVLTIACQSLYPALFIHILVNLTGASA